MIKIVKKISSEEKSEKEIQTQKILSKMRRESEEEQASVFAASLNLPYIDTNLVPIATDAIKTLTEEESKKYNLAIIQKMARIVTAVSTDPFENKTQDFIKKLTRENGWQIKVFVVSRTNLERIWEKYKKIVFVDYLDQMAVNLSGEELENFEEELKELITLKQRISELSTTQIIDIIMAGGHKLGASDIHLEPQEKEVRLRYRIDGVLQDIAFFPLNVFKSITSRIKMMGGMKINVRDIAQDGTFKIKIKSKKDEKKIDTRVSIIPGNFGESIVIRLLNPESVNVKLETLGLRGLAYEQIQKQIIAPNGMILNTGPTGSGKTTTLYAIINKLNEPDKKIVTIEDPIEYELPGISQSQVEKSRGYTFASGLRAIVRQDPDIILVGEIRDDETADIAINSALTGHLVLSSLHTNNAIGSIPRLIELGTKPSLISPSINAIIGQRLVRKLCDCKEAYEPAKESIESLKKILSIISPKSKIDVPKNIFKLYRAKGCPKCNSLGYKGRIGIFEVLTINPEIEKLVMDLASETELTLAALESGMITMLQDGILKALEGITSIDEVKRVTGEGEFLEDIYEKLMAATLGRSILIDSKSYKSAKDNIGNFKKFQKIISKAKTTEIAKILFAAASILGVGDIHIEPQAKSVKIRFRIDGILQDVASISLTEYPAFLGEIKLLSGVKTEVRQGVVDSRFTIKFDEDIKDAREPATDVRVSIILGGYGETVVLRLLFKTNLEYDLKKLGIRQQNLDKIMEEISKPNGVILNTGPTGSGKTTTLYSILKHLNKPEAKIITVEDPIEYQMEGILQTPVNDKEGYTFATALRQLLRQNPDVMMIGEIRDDETAKIAMQAALTGHLVFSTLHTNSAAGAVARLANMGISPQDIAMACDAFIAQRLIRRLCDCKKKVKPTVEEKATIEKVLKTISQKSGVTVPKIGDIYKPGGCKKCNHIGYKGRMTVSEVFKITKNIQELVTRGAITSELQDKAVTDGMLTMTQDGILRVLEGETTLEEVERVTDL
ncbi:MAG TPA: type II/IV secretion system protein [Candidatus Moranbacteria bacterium]|nr:type II/IV secretion system protein [Candidatus Moranbacteria bacterium]